MKWVYRIFRTIIVSSLFLAVGIPIFLYLVLWLAPVQQKIRSIAQTELSNLLGANLSIGSLELQPFTRIKLSEISLTSEGDTLLTADAINATLSGRGLLRGRIVVNGVELMSPNIKLKRDSANSPLNLQPIIDRLKGDGSKPPSRFDVAVHAVVLRSGTLSYDVTSEPYTSAGFDPNHIEINNLSADLTAPKISNRDISIDLKRLTAREQSGLYVRNLAVSAELTDSLLTLNGLTLKLKNTSLGFSDINVNLRGYEVANIELQRGSIVYPSDFEALHPALASVISPINLEARVELMRDSMVVRKLDIHTPHRDLFADATGEASLRGVTARALDLGVNGTELSRTIQLFTPLKSEAATLLANLGEISFAGTAAWGKPADVKLSGILATDIGIIDVDAGIANKRLNGTLEADELDLDKLIAGKGLGTASLGAVFDLTEERGNALVSIDHLIWRDHDYQNISLSGDYTGRTYNAIVEADDSLLRGELSLTADLTPEAFSATIDGDIAAFAPHAMRLTNKYPDYVISGQIKGQFEGEEPLRPTGQLMVSNLRFLNPDGKGLREALIALTSDFSSAEQKIRLQSDLVDAEIAGQINLRTLTPTVKNLLAEALPQYFSPQPTDSIRINDLTIFATIKNDAPLFGFINMPMQLLYPATINATLSDTGATLNLSAPYLRKGNSLISHVNLNARLGEDSWFAAGAVMPSKFGDMTIHAAGKLSDAAGNVDLSFANDSHSFAGDLKINVKPLYEGLDANILPSTITLGGVGWTLEPAYIGLRNGMAIIHGFGLIRPGQELTINGVASRFEEDRLLVKLDNINVDYIFQTLQLAETLQFGGDATGTVTASALFGSEPILRTENLHVKNLKYGGCVMGNADIRSRWNNETRGIEIYADVDDSAHHGSTTVDGKIFIVDKKLDFKFLANHSPAGFLRTFMKTWASEIGGTATGMLHLFGGFKSVNLEGDVAAENFSLGVGYTGVTYYAADTVRIRPGNIALNNIIVRDKNGRTGLLNGKLIHNYFKDVEFRFVISDIDRMLVLDTHPTPENDRWYGTIRANGTAEIFGKPGLVKITADAITAPGSDFTFALTNAQSAAQYTFLTFRDITPLTVSSKEFAPEPGPELDKQMRAQLARAVEDEAASNFQIELHIDATPAATINLVMDPVAGDKITGIGSGHIDISYGSDTDEMRLYGGYKIDKGEYNFSLQDIILKTFTITDGSEIAFHGDPMEAALNISAYHKVNANLSDLDESFLNDKEVQRTVVPVWAMLNVNGYLQDPQISFDIDLPTLTSDVKRKVKSIISTEDMMNRQMIYLLVMNRFYTPEYMAATKGNDLMSVASGTLSSQLSNILGQLSDKISIAPSLRTETEDFSDMEFDVALSSTLLNNRLLLNGNFGYRDKSLNNNQFIGDFDIEYLLTRRGNWRLKAYNHFNDRNLYMKQALTTQGLGLVFKHDFDHLFFRSNRAK